MKRIHWWTVLGVLSAGSLAALLGQTVWGQPEGKTLPLPPGAFPVDKGDVVDLLPMPGGNPGTVTEPFGPTTPPPAKVDAVVQASASVVKAEKPASVNFDVPPGKQQPAVSVEWVGPTAIRINQAMPCQIVVRNMSHTPAQNVVVRHRLGQGVIVKSCEPDATNDSGELIWNLGTLAPEQTRRIDLQLVAQARGPINCHATVTFTAVAGHLVQVREPQLAVKMRAPEKTIAGETVTLVFAISNPGDGVAEVVKAKLMLPEGLEHPRGKMVEFDVGNLAPKETRTMQLACVAKGTGPQKCMIVTTGDGNLTSNDSASIDILLPKLDIAMSGPKLRYLHRHAVYTVKVTNPGSAPANNVEVQEQIPAGFRFHQAQGGQYHEATKLVSWNLGDLQPGQSKEVAIDLIPTETGEHRLVAHAKTARGLKMEAEVRTLVEGLPALEMEVAHMDDPIEVGAETAYEIRVANKGTKTETNVEVVCTLPDQLEFRGAKCTTTLRYRQEGRDLVFEKLPRLAPKAEVIFRVQVKGIAPGDVRFQTRIRADGLQNAVLREESTRIYSDEMPQRGPISVQPAPYIAPKTPPTPVAPAPMPVLPTPAPVKSAPMAVLPTPSPATPAPLPVPTPGAPSIPTPAPAAPAPLPGPMPAIPTPAPIPAAPSPLPLPTPTPAPAPPAIPLPTPGN